MDQNNSCAVGIYITRNCNLNCEYCTVKDKKLVELNYEQWCDAFDIVADIGVTKVNILGGEPTIKKDIDRIIKYAVQEKKLAISLISNGTSDFEMLKKLVDSGLQSFSSSVDVLDGTSSDVSSSIKSKVGLESLKKMKEYGINDLTAYCVLSRITMPRIVNQIKVLSDLGIATYILPFHYGKGEEFWQTRAKNYNPKLSLTAENTEELKAVTDQILELKNNGYLVKNSYSYLRNLVNNYIGFKWHCTDIMSELRIDADGKLMYCHDYSGDSPDRISIFDIRDKVKFEAYKQKRREGIKNCPGCYWPSQYHNLEALTDN